MFQKVSVEQSASLNPGLSRSRADGPEPHHPGMEESSEHPGKAGRKRSGSRNPDPRKGYVHTGSWRRLSTRPPADTEIVVPKVTKNCC